MGQGKFFLLLCALLALNTAQEVDKCAQHTNCTACAEFGDCVWCNLNATEGNYCVTGTMFGSDDSGCPMMTFQYRQCAMPGFWVLFIAASLIAVIVLVIILLVVLCFKRKQKGHNLLGINYEPNKVHTMPLDVLIEKQSSAGLGIVSLSDEDHPLGPSLPTDSLKLALNVPDLPAEEEATEELAPPLRQIGPWKEYQDDTGKYYYYNVDTEDSVWDPPPPFKYSDEHEYTPEEEEYIANNTGRYLVRALYSYEATDPTLWQLSIKEGDLIWVVDSHHEEDWWVGEMYSTKEQGYFAKSYVQVLKRVFKTNTKQGAKISELTNNLRQSGLK